MSIDFTVRELYNISVSYMCVSGDCMGSSYWGAFDWDLEGRALKLSGFYWLGELLPLVSELLIHSGTICV